MKFCSKKGVPLHFNTHVVLECANLLTVVDDYQTYIHSLLLAIYIYIG